VHFYPVAILQNKYSLVGLHHYNYSYFKKLYIIPEKTAQVLPFVFLSTCNPKLPQTQKRRTMYFSIFSAILYYIPDVIPRTDS
jgi:hypothetical protein